MSDTLTRPTRTTLPDLEQGSDAWHGQRRGIVTASIVGNLITTRKLSAGDYDCPCGALANEPCRSKSKTGTGTIKSMHPERAEIARKSSSGIVFETASNDVSRGLTTMLVAERITGWTEDMFVSDDMMRGVEDEPRARDKYSQHYAPVAEVGFMTYEDSGIKLGYSPDGLVGDDGLIEIKSRRPKKHLSTILSGHPPVENMPQLQTGLLVSGRKWIDYVSYCGGMPLWVKRVYPDQRWFDAILAAGRAFEANAAEMISIYQDEIAGFPSTDRELTEIRF
ncbi:YqaJ viral recombinase family protein [Rhodococcoides fascians]|uniref:YqaJ viral recombinase family protein n=1 Tax=Rhodococcoides fascians TaxID=1828 RepID=UPI00050C80F7|nr:YqaJ viral recombinase family protein [Rhodococcus fascians]